ncbi:MAG TPA: hypothetical protein VM802_06330 [Chitinophaga sp.]|uniref:hypothetical protein n=1 Tax=Chitinophaga sp. TaxID=1869181 RepID=UPI002B9F2CF0|nr:hypothetical protein [Chitinophaga sp.]HVI44464.1 hypothetical protein [Chitinophaga sp.]
MKRLTMALAFTALLFASCRKNTTEEIKVHDRPVVAGTRPLMPGDPNLDPNWDWTQQSWKVYFNNANGTIGEVTTLNPFIDGSQKIYGTTNVANADMYPARGWMLVARDFGTPTVANAYPFVLLYNKYRGTLRVCILRTYDVLSSYQQITLSYANHTTYSDVFKYSPAVNVEANYNDIKIANTKNSTYTQVAVTTAGVQEWMIADFDVRGYSPDIPDNLAFNIGMAEVAESEIVLNGSMQLNGTIQPQGSEPTVLGGIQKLINMITSLDGLGSAITGITGSFTDTSFSVGNIGGAFNALQKFVSAFSSGSGGGGTYNIKLTGTISQKGTIKLKSPKTSFSVYLKNQAGTLGYRALQNISWGVINIIKWPILNDVNTPITQWVQDPNGPDYSEVTVGYNREVTFEPNFVTKALVINPNVKNEVAKIEAAYIRNGDEPMFNYEVGPFSPLAQFEATANSSPYPNFRNTFSSFNGWLNFIAIGIKITFNNGATVYQVFPI